MNVPQAVVPCLCFARFSSLPQPLITLSVTVGIALSTLASPPAMAMAPTRGSMPESVAFTSTLIADVAESIAPSVVNIDVETETHVNGSSALPNFGGLPFNDQFLRRFLGLGDGSGNSPFTPFGDGTNAAPQMQVITGNGSGMILNHDGYILTNNHVVSTAQRIKVTLNDGRKFQAKLIGRDSYSDVAVIKIEAPNLTPVKLGNSDQLRPGEWVIAVGSPLGFDHTVTQGIVSALSRRIPDLNSNLSFIQTDAAINPGNSGGPLANLKGEVVGINAAISGKGQNIGFAIPINTVKEIANTLIAGKAVVRPWIGVSLMDLNPELAKQIGLSPEVSGVVIAKVFENSPAYKAGLMQSDVIERIDGKSTAKAESIQEALRAHPPNTTMKLDILRNGHPITVSVTSEPLPEATEDEQANPARRGNRTPMAQPRLVPIRPNVKMPIHGSSQAQ